MCVLSLAGCGKNMADVTIDYGDSRLYTTQDMDAAISLIETTFATWKGCELHRISYISDEECNADNIAWMNDLRAPDDMQETFTECIAFTSEFHSPKKGGGAWNADTEYTGWKWWLARSDGGEWKLMTWGYKNRKTGYEQKTFG